MALVADEFTGNGFDDPVYFGHIKNKKPFLPIVAKTYPTAYFKKGDPFIEEIERTGIGIGMEGDIAAQVVGVTGFQVDFGEAQEGEGDGHFLFRI